MFIHQMFISMVFRSNVHFYKRRKYRDLKGLSDIFVNFIVNDKNNYYLLWIGLFLRGFIFPHFHFTTIHGILKLAHFEFLKRQVLLSFLLREINEKRQNNHVITSICAQDFCLNNNIFYTINLHCFPKKILR